MGCSRAPCPPATLVYAQLALVCAEHAHYNKITHTVLLLAPVRQPNLSNCYSYCSNPLHRTDYTQS
jgi:hypothetical protein